MSHLHSLPHHAVLPSWFQQHIHPLCSSLPPGCPQTPTHCLSSSSSAPGLVTSPFFLLPVGQMGQGSPWFQAVFPPGPAKSTVSSSVPESCSPLQLGGTRLHKSPVLGEKQLAQTQVEGARLGAGRRLPAWCATSAKKAWHGVSTARMEGTLGPPGSPALPWIPFFVPGPSDTELQGQGLQAASSWGGVRVMGLVQAEPPTVGFRQKGEMLEESANYRCRTSKVPTMNPACAVTASSLRKRDKGRKEWSNPNNNQSRTAVRTAAGSMMRLKLEIHGSRKPSMVCDGNRAKHHQVTQSTHPHSAQL